VNSEARGDWYSQFERKRGAATMNKDPRAVQTMISRFCTGHPRHLRYIHATKHTQNVMQQHNRARRLISWTHGHFSSINEDHFKSMMNSVYHISDVHQSRPDIGQDTLSPVVSQNEKEDKKKIKKKLISKTRFAQRKSQTCLGCEPETSRIHGSEDLCRSRHADNTISPHN